MQVKGGNSRQEGRVLKALGLAHATSNRGADHLYALPTIDLTENIEVAKGASRVRPRVNGCYQRKIQSKHDSVY